MRLLLPLLLLTLANCNNTIDISCALCGVQICYTFNGAAFDNHIFPANSTSCPA